mmetsp:Transcript_21537/g.39632  ORF Transcript_21537/g.39632 Transcript_21537/m.39632 type:complete len:209 (+) Transcript_21537:587-1213(+)
MVQGLLDNSARDSTFRIGNQLQDQSINNLLPLCGRSIFKDGLNHVPAIWRASKQRNALKGLLDDFKGLLDDFGGLVAANMLKKSAKDAAAMPVACNLLDRTFELFGHKTGECNGQHFNHLLNYEICRRIQGRLNDMRLERICKLESTAIAGNLQCQLHHATALRVEGHVYYFIFDGCKGSHLFFRIVSAELSPQFSIIHFLSSLKCLR